MSIYIETPRLYIRELLPTDDEGMFEMDSDPAVHRYLGNTPVTSIERSREVIAIIRKQYGDFGIGRWAVIKKRGDEFLGWTGFKFMDKPVNKRSEFLDFGYRFKSSCWKQGYGYESAVAALDHGLNKLGFKDVYAMTDVENAGSRRILEKLGFRYVETFPYDGSNYAWVDLGLPVTWYEYAGQKK